MRAIREILRLRWVQRQPHRAVARSTGRSVGAVHETLRRAADAGLDWARVQAMPDDALEAALYRRPAVAGGQRDRPPPDCAYIHTERAKPGVTLELLHLEYLERHPTGYRYTQFCDIYRRWLGRRRLSMRQVHRGGEKGFVDYAGKRPGLTDPATGARRPVELFLMALGASSYTYAEATATQQLPDWIASHTRAFAYYGGVPGAVVPDQLKSAVTVPCRYEPGVNRTYAELAAHYGTTFATVFEKDGKTWSPDYAAIARAYGIEGVKVASAAELKPALAKAIRSKKPVVIDVFMKNEPVPTAGHWNIMDIYSPGKKVHHVATGG